MSKNLRVPFAAALIAAGAFVIPAPSGRSAEVTHAYRVEGKGNSSSLSAFARHAAQTLSDDRGWNLGGSMRFVRVDSGGDFTLWLAAPEQVSSFSRSCSSNYSCRVGRDVVINERNWNNATPAWNSAGESLHDYRHMVVNHEVGHWLGLGHVNCPSSGRLAPVMMQQSKGLGGCEPNPWPLEREREEVARRHGVEVRRGPQRRDTFTDVGTSANGGYRILKGDGSVFGYGGATYHGSAFGATPSVAVEIEQVPEADGYWIATSDGSIFGYGAAAGRYHGSPQDRGETGDVVSMAATPNGDGYWVTTSDGAVMAFGEATDHGPSIATESPVVEIVAGPTGGYWLATADGSVLGYGDAAGRYEGSPRDVGVEEGIVSMSATVGGSGYWLASDDGSVFGFGDAEYRGSMHGELGHPLTDLAGVSGGYRLLGRDGAIFTFGASYEGSAAD